MHESKHSYSHIHFTIGLLLYAIWSIGEGKKEISNFHIGCTQVTGVQAGKHTIYSSWQEIKK